MENFIAAALGEKCPIEFTIYNASIYLTGYCAWRPLEGLSYFPEDSFLLLLLERFLHVR